MANAIMLYRHEEFDDITKEIRYLLGDYAFEYDIPGLRTEFIHAINARLFENAGRTVSFVRTYFIIQSGAPDDVELVIEDAIDEAIEWVERLKIAEKYRSYSRFTL